MEVPPGPLPLQPVRNADFKEVVLDVDGAPALRFASAYGFRNIQTLMRQMKRRRCAYDYVEVMACPSGDSAVCLRLNSCEKMWARVQWRCTTLASRPLFYDARSVVSLPVSIHVALAVTYPTICT